LLDAKNLSTPYGDGFPRSRFNEVLIQQLPVGHKAPVDREKYEQTVGGGGQVLYIGVDAHKAASHITIMDDAGKAVQRKQVRTSHLAFATPWRPITSQ
jgi:hypothetical protein